MCSGIAFFFGLFLFLRGQLIINNRVIPRSRTRLIGLVLMAPLLIGMVAGMLLFSPGVIDFETLQNAMFIELGALVIAIAVVYYLVSTMPPSDSLPASPMRPFTPPSATPPPVPDILTVPEAAMYLRVTEAEVMRLIDEGKLPAARIGGSFRIARIAIDDFLREG
jgi:excisionase family DNA binding protein